MNAPRRPPELRVIRDHVVLAVRALGESLTVGRLPDNDLVLDDERVSGHHGRLQRDGAHWRYTDVGSTNGTVVAGGPALQRGESCVLREDSQLLLGDTVLELRLGAPEGALAEPGEPPASDTAPDTAPVAAAIAAPGAASGAASDSAPDSAQDAAPGGRPRLLVVLRGKASVVPLRADSAIIGRGAGCDVRIDDGSVSALHARLARQDGHWLLADLSSTNGTRLGLRRVSGAEEVRDGDHLIIGAADLLFVDEAPLSAQARAERLALEERALRLAQDAGLLGPAQVREARAALIPGAPGLGEYLVLRGWLSVGAWVELQSEALVPPPAQDVGAAARSRRLLVTLLLLAGVLTVAIVIALFALGERWR